MHKISIVGLDNTGKTSVVEYCGLEEGVDTLSLTTPLKHRSFFAKEIYSNAYWLAQKGEIHKLKYISGAAYLAHLIPYAIEEQRCQNQFIVSDRDPILDSLCYAFCYLPKPLASQIRTPLNMALEALFAYPTTYIHLEISPETSISRNRKTFQHHDSLSTLKKLHEVYENELQRIEDEGIGVLRINTEEHSLDEVKAMVRGHLAMQKRIYEARGSQLFASHNL